MKLKSIIIAVAISCMGLPAAVFAHSASNLNSGQVEVTPCNYCMMVCKRAGGRPGQCLEFCARKGYCSSIDKFRLNKYGNNK